jgi:hypothetical protein
MCINVATMGVHSRILDSPAGFTSLSTAPSLGLSTIDFYFLNNVLSLFLLCVLFSVSYGKNETRHGQNMLHIYADACLTI